MLRKPSRVRVHRFTRGDRQFEESIVAWVPRNRRKRQLYAEIIAECTSFNVLCICHASADEIFYRYWNLAQSISLQFYDAEDEASSNVQKPIRASQYSWRTWNTKCKNARRPPSFVLLMDREVERVFINFLAVLVNKPRRLERNGLNLRIDSHERFVLSQAAYCMRPTEPSKHTRCLLHTLFRLHPSTKPCPLRSPAWSPRNPLKIGPQLFTFASVSLASPQQQPPCSLIFASRVACREN